MPFDVFLVPTTTTPGSAAQVQAEVRKAVAVEGGVIDPDGKTVRTVDGTRFVMGGVDPFQIDQLSPGLCRIVFRAALNTGTVIVTGGTDPAPLRIKGVKGEVILGRMRTDPIATPQALCVRLGRDLVAWNRFISEEQAEGTLGPNQEMLEPPASPGAEARLSSDPSGVGARCLASATPLVEKERGTIQRTVLSQNPQYGVVWRADLTSPKFPNSPSRLVCWKLPHSDRVMFEVRPLEMFDPKQSVGPLPAE